MFWIIALLKLPPSAICSCAKGSIYLAIISRYWIESIVPSIRMSGPTESLDTRPILYLLSDGIKVFLTPDHDVSSAKFYSRNLILGPTSHATRPPDELVCGRTSVWENISIDILIKLIDSMPRRCKAVLLANGYATKY